VYVFQGLESLIEYYQRESSTAELPCQLEKPCPAGQMPPPLSLSVGYTNVLHKAISAGIHDILTVRLFLLLRLLEIEDVNETLRNVESFNYCYSGQKS